MIISDCLIFQDSFYQLLIRDLILNVDMLNRKNKSALPEYCGHEEGDGRDGVLNGRGEGRGCVVETQQVESLVCCYSGIQTKQ